MQGKRSPDIDVEEFYTLYGPMVLRRCRNLLKDEDKAMDAMQDTFAKVLSNRDRLTGQYPSSLLFRIATNTCLNMIRSEKKRSGENEDDILINIALYDEKEEKLIVTDLLDRIFKREKQSTREIAVMHYLDGMTYQEVSRAVGLSVSGVRKRLRELRSRITLDRQGGRL